MIPFQPKCHQQEQTVLSSPSPWSADISSVYIIEFMSNWWMSVLSNKCIESMSVLSNEWMLSNEWVYFVINVE
jgi:hypothetical protein